VRALPAIDVGDQLSSGPDALERATTALLEGMARGR
jgi:hypothetical protein